MEGFVPFGIFLHIDLGHEIRFKGKIMDDCFLTLVKGRIDLGFCQSFKEFGVFLDGSRFGSIEADEIALFLDAVFGANGLNVVIED